MDEWRTRTGKSTSPVLCDVGLYYRMLKLQYSVTYVSVATDSFFAHTPLLFGVWHSYKYCVTERYRQFLPLWAALEYKDFLTAPRTVHIVTNFNLSMMEHWCCRISGSWQSATPATGCPVEHLAPKRNLRRPSLHYSETMLLHSSTLATGCGPCTGGDTHHGLGKRPTKWYNSAPFSFMHCGQRGSMAVHGCITIGATAVGSPYGCPS